MLLLKSGPAPSPIPLYALARLFLEKPERYEVRLIGKAESRLYRLGDNGALSLNREFLERNAFRLAQSEFYRIDITESEPIKGNFSNVARCRLSGTFLGPTNHHNYQSQLRSLYEQRFSRRMSFADYQRQIEIVNDAELIDRWKEDARKVTTYTTSREQVPSTFSSAVDTERHFRSHYLDGLITDSGGSDYRRGDEPAFVGQDTQSGDRGRVGAGNAFALSNDAGIGWTTSSERAQRFPASTRDVVCLTNPDTHLCSRTRRCVAVGECDSRSAGGDSSNQSQTAF